MDKDKLLEIIDRKDMDPGRKLVVLQSLLQGDAPEGEAEKLRGPVTGGPKKRRSRAKKEGEDA